MDELFHNLLPLDNFKILKRGTSVYSKTYGPGEVFRIYGKDVVVQFGHRRERIFLENKDLCLIPVSDVSKPKARTIAYVDGQKVSMRTMKKAMNEMVKEDLIGIKPVADALGIKKKKLLEICQKATIKVYDCDTTSPKIERSELQRLNQLKDLM